MSETRDSYCVPTPPVDSVLAEQSEVAEAAIDAYAEVVNLLETKGRVTNIEPGTCTSHVRYAYWTDPEAGIRYRAHQFSRWARPGTWDNFVMVGAFKRGETKPFAQIMVAEDTCLPYDTYPELHLIADRPHLAQKIGHMARTKAAAVAPAQRGPSSDS